MNIENQKLQQRIIEQNSIIENNQKQNRKLERKLGKVSTRLEAIAKTVREILLVMDKRLLVRYVSPLARQLFGKSIHDRPDLLRYTEHPELVQLVQDAMSDENAWVDLDWQVQIANVPYQARIVTFDDGVVLALRDVSLLQRLERARREFVGNISHELRTPLASIVLVLESLLENSTAQSADTLAGLHKIQAEVDELQQMAQELLDLAQIESGRALFRLMPIGVEDLFEPAFERMREQATRKEQTLIISYGNDLAALVDIDQIRRAFNNLVHNAIKFTPNGGEIRIKVKSFENELCVCVRDNGPGIAPKDLPRVFERFFKGDRTRSSGGTGLGLAIAKHVVVEGHGGRIWAESDGVVGKGTAFYFTIPRVLISELPKLGHLSVERGDGTSTETAAVAKHK